MDRDGVVDRRADTRGHEPLAKRVPIAAPDDVLMEDVRPVGPAHGRRCPSVRQGQIVGVGDGPAPVVLLAQARELDAKDCRLKLIQAAVDARNSANPVPIPAVLAQRAHPVSERGVIGRDAAAVPKSAEVLRRIEAKSRRVAP